MMKPKNTVSRISMSLAEELLNDLDAMVAVRGFESRSQAISDMINHYLIEHKRQIGDDIMAGTITLLYDHSTRGLQKQLGDLQHRYIDEVISSLHVNLMYNQTMEVMLVQGPAGKIQRIADEMITLRGVVTGRMQLMAAVIPPLHPLPA
jgi:CopG family nickel-responsive transcriptional regulator